jgi:hypothetical protein
VSLQEEDLIGQIVLAYQDGMPSHAHGVKNALPILREAKAEAWGEAVNKLYRWNSVSLAEDLEEANPYVEKEN